MARLSCWARLSDIPGHPLRRVQFPAQVCNRLLSLGCYLSADLRVPVGLSSVMRSVCFCLSELLPKLCNFSLSIRFDNLSETLIFRLQSFGCFVHDP